VIVYVADNFKARHYVIEKMDVSGGKCTITAKDTLKKASTKKAQVPKPSTGIISDVGGINDTDVIINLEPVGVGNSEYDASGWVTLSGSEVASFTRSGDVLTIVRAQYNTEAIAHDENSVVQQCYRKNEEVNIIENDLCAFGSIIDAPEPINATIATSTAINPCYPCRFSIIIINMNEFIIYADPVKTYTNKSVYN
jgi:hypothetical protein